jgi:hypothetical protein
VLFVFAAFVRNVDLEREIREDDLSFSVIPLFVSSLFLQPYVIRINPQDDVVDQLFQFFCMP